MRLCVRGIFAHGVHESGIACLVGTRLSAGTGMLQVEAIAPTPFPGVVQVEHCHHLSLPHFHEQVVKTGEDGIIIDAWGNLQGGLHLGLHSPLAIATHKDTQVIDAHGFEVVKFTDQSLTVSALSLTAEDGTIPEVGADIIIWLSVTEEPAVFHLYKWGRLPLGKSRCHDRNDE